MFELEILFANIVVPGLIFGVAGLLYRGLPARFSKPVGAILWSVAAIAAIEFAFGWRNGFALWPEDAWQRIPRAAGLVALATVAGELLDAGQNRLSSVFVGCLYAIAIAVGTWWIFPQGTGWEQLQPEFWRWLVVVIIGCGGSAILVSQFSNRRAAIWGFLCIPWTMAAAYLVSQSFIKVTEPILAVATVLGMASIFSCLTERTRPLQGVAGGMLCVALGALAHGKFYSYLETPAIAYQTLMVVPMLAAAVSLLPLVLFRKPVE